MPYHGKVVALQTLHMAPQGAGRFTVPPSGPCGLKASVASVESTRHKGAFYAYMENGSESRRLVTDSVVFGPD